MKKRDYCGLCGSRDLGLVLDLGEMPLANAFHDNTVELDRYPLRVYFCRNCTSVQLLDIVDPELVFTKYEYLTSASKPLSDHFRIMGQFLLARFTKSEDDLVVEIGGNDGVLLEAIKDHCRVLNIDPAHTACDICREKGIPTLEIFFNAEDAKAIEKIYGKAQVIVANNVMAHIDDFQDVMRGITALLDPNGVFVFEVHWVGNLVGEGGFDQIYHEHLFYHSLTALQNSNYLNIFDVEMVPIHGQSMRVYVGNGSRPIHNRVFEWLQMEKDLGLDKETTYIGLFDKIHDNKMKLREALKNYEKVVGYGAPAKGNTLVNYFGIKLAYIVDTTPGKQGLFTPGSNIPVYAPGHLYDDPNPPDGIIVLAWNYADVILEKEQALRRMVDFIIPVPEVKVMTKIGATPAIEGQDAP